MKWRSYNKEKKKKQRSRKRDKNLWNRSMFTKLLGITSGISANQMPANQSADTIHVISWLAWRHLPWERLGIRLHFDISFLISVYQGGGLIRKKIHFYTFFKQFKDRLRFVPTYRNFFWNEKSVLSRKFQKNVKKLLNLASN